MVLQVGIEDYNVLQNILLVGLLKMLHDQEPLDGSL